MSSSFWQDPTAGLNADIVRMFEAGKSHPLAAVINGTSGIPAGASGVYALYYFGPCPDCRSGHGGTDPVYVGSAAASPTGPRGKARLLGRLREHHTSIAASTLRVADLAFRFVALPDELAPSAEHFLIRQYAPIWNKSGFGSKVSGGGRTSQKVSIWDSLHPGRAGRGTVARTETPKPKAAAASPRARKTQGR
jgi:hypothetical protein